MHLSDVRIWVLSMLWLIFFVFCLVKETIINFLFTFCWIWKPEKLIQICSYSASSPTFVVSCLVNFPHSHFHHSSNNCQLSHLPPCCASGPRIGPDAKQELAEIEKEEKKCEIRPRKSRSRRKYRTTWELIALVTTV